MCRVSCAPAVIFLNTGIWSPPGLQLTVYSLLQPVCLSLHCNRAVIFPVPSALMPDMHMLCYDKNVLSKCLIAVSCSHTAAQ